MLGLKKKIYIVDSTADDDRKIDLEYTGCYAMVDDVYLAF